MSERHSRSRTARGMLAAGLASLAWTVPVAGQAPAGLVGDAARGERYFTTEYKCYACHGFDAQTGERRLLPMNYTQEGFITFVQNSPLPQMPAFPDMPAQALADVYAYIRSIPVDAPEVEQLPLLEEIRDAKLRALRAE